MKRRIQVSFGDSGRVDARRKLIDRSRDGVTYVLCGGVDIAIELKRHDHHRPTVARNRSQFLDSGNCSDGVFDDRADFRLNLLGSRADVRRANEDRWHIHVGETINAQLRKCSDSGDDQSQNKHQREHRSFHANFSQPIHE